MRNAEGLFPVYEYEKVSLIARIETVLFHVPVGIYLHHQQRVQTAPALPMPSIPFPIQDQTAFRRTSTWDYTQEAQRPSDLPVPREQCWRNIKR